MELELDMMELQYMQQDYVSYSYQDQGLDDYVAQYDDFIRISSFQEEHDRQQSAGVSPRFPSTEISRINFNQFVGNRPDNFAEFSSDETDYDETGILLKCLHDHFEVNDMLDYSAKASKNGVKYDQQIASPGRLIYCQSSHVNSQLNNQIDYSAGLSLGQANNGAAAASLQANYNDELGGISSEEERMITCSSSSSKDKKKKSTSGALSSSSSKPATNGTDRSLKVHRDSYSITKRAPPFIAPPQYRTPIIIHTYSPKIIHTTPSKFMWLVQSLTGSSETRSRCLKNAPPSTSTAASMEAQDIKPSYHHEKPHSAASMESEDVKPISAYTPSYHHDKPLHSEASIQASIQTASAYHHDKYHKLSQAVHQSPPSPLNSFAITPTFITSHHQNNCSFMHVINNPCTSSNHNIKQIVTSATSSPRILMTNSNLSSQSPSNLSPSLTNYIELCSINTEQSSSPTSCCSTIEVSPRGALISARDFEGTNAIKSFISAGGTIITPPAPNFERWPAGDQLDYMEGYVHSNKCLANFLQEANPSYLSNLKTSVSKHNVDGSKGSLLPTSLRGPNDGNCNHVMNSAQYRPSSTPNTYTSTHNGALDRFSNKAISSPCLTPFWDSYPMESFLTQEPI